jgi:hypothetical protein
MYPLLMRQERSQQSSTAAALLFRAAAEDVWSARHLDPPRLLQCGRRRHAHLNRHRPVFHEFLPLRADVVFQRGTLGIAGGIAFRWKDYRIVPEARLRHEGPGRWKTMTLAPHEFIRRFLMHVLPKGFHRIRHYGLFANGNRAASIARAASFSVLRRPSLSQRRTRPQHPTSRACSPAPARAAVAA